MTTTTLTREPRHLCPDEAPAELPESERSPRELLIAEEEVTLARRIEAGVLAQDRLDRGCWAGRVERSTFRLLVEEGAAARERLIVANIRLVHYWARRSYRGGLDYDDLAQHGMLGLIHAVEKFDYQQGIKFSTYATWWIRQAMGRAVADEGRTIRVPVHAYEKARAIRTALWTAALGWDDAVAASQLVPGDWSATQVAQARTHLRPVYSLDLIAESADLVDPTEDFTREVDDAVAGAAACAHLLDVVEHQLGWRAAEVLCMRCGFGGEPGTLEEIGQRFGVTRERIRQIEKKALDLLREVVGE